MLINLPLPTPEMAAAPQLPRNAFTIVPSDNNTFSAPVAVYVGGAGAVMVLPWNAESEVTYEMLAGAIVPVMVRMVFFTDTTATSLVGSY
ncbi:MAG: hypothetical protein HYV17_07960 [Xanthomonadales bacterium]|nr:hypothetical protein [Xanthomonadales bacterium]